MTLFALTMACTPPVEAPAELGELTLYLYENFEGEGADGEGAMPAGLLSLEEWLVDQPLSADDDVDDRAVTPPTLPFDRLGGAVAPATADEELQVPVAVWVRAKEGMDTQLELMLDENQTCIASGTTTWHQQTWTDGDAACFADGSCEVLRSESEIHIDSLANVFLDMKRDYRWVELEDGRMAVVAREWLPEQEDAYDGDGTWDQRFSLIVWLPEADGKVLRFYSMWSSVTLAGIGDDFYSNTVKNGLNEHFENSVTFAAGESCDDRDNDKPEG
jgi:hypothetical protein